MLNNSYQANRITSYDSLSKIQQAELDTYIYGMIRVACIYHPDGFTVPDLVGGRFKDWSGTPLDYIYQYHVARGIGNPDAEAGKDMGRIFKYLIAKDKTKSFKLVGTEQRFYPVNVYALVD